MSYKIAVMTSFYLEDEVGLKNYEQAFKSLNQQNTEIVHFVRFVSSKLSEEELTDRAVELLSPVEADFDEDQEGGVVDRIISIAPKYESWPKTYNAIWSQVVEYQVDEAPDLKFACVLNLDDRFTVEGVDCLAHTLSSHPTNTLVYGDYLLFVNDYDYKKPTTGNFQKGSIFEMCTPGPFTMWPIRREFELAPYKLFNEDLTRMADWHLYVRLFMAGQMVRCLEPVACFLHRMDSLSHRNRDTWNKDLYWMKAWAKLKKEEYDGRD